MDANTFVYRTALRLAAALAESIVEHIQAAETPPVEGTLLRPGGATILRYATGFVACAKKELGA